MGLSKFDKICISNDDDDGGDDDNNDGHINKKFPKKSNTYKYTVHHSVFHR